MSDVPSLNELLIETAEAQFQVIEQEKILERHQKKLDLLNSGLTTLERRLYNEMRKQSASDFAVKGQSGFITAVRGSGVVAVRWWPARKEGTHNG